LSNFDIQLENIRNPDTVFQLVAVLGTPQRSVSIIGCAIELLPYYEGPLTLMRIPVDHDLIPVLRSFTGTNLSLRDCPGFHARALRIMNLAPYQHHQIRCTPHVRRLHISNCPNICVNELKRLIEGRRMGLGGQPSITELHLYALPEISPRDVAWFKSKVQHFSYRPYTPDDAEL